MTAEETFLTYHATSKKHELFACSFCDKKFLETLKG